MNFNLQCVYTIFGGLAKTVSVFSNGNHLFVFQIEASAVNLATRHSCNLHLLWLFMFYIFNVWSINCLIFVIETSKPQ